jgi:TPR repeat protein
MMYLYGTGVRENQKTGMHWMVKAAGQDNACAEFEIGSAYYSGRGVDINNEVAFSWMKKAADGGCIDAYNELGRAYSSGKDWGTEQNYAAAYEWWKKAADAGSQYAFSNIGDMYRDGHYFPQDYAMAAEWYRKGVAINDARCIDNLALLYDQGHGVAQSKSQAFSLFQRAAAMGNIEAQYYAGLHYYNGDLAAFRAKGAAGVADAKQAMDWFKKAVDEGPEDAVVAQAKAQAMLAWMYHFGHGAARNDVAALEWASKAADNDNTLGAMLAGYLKIMGDGVEHDDDEAESRFEGPLGSATCKDKSKVDMPAIDQVTDNQRRAMAWLKRIAECEDGMKSAAQLLREMAESLRRNNPDYYRDQLSRKQSNENELVDDAGKAMQSVGDAN